MTKFPKILSFLKYFLYAIGFYTVSYYLFIFVLSVYLNQPFSFYFDYKKFLFEHNFLIFNTLLGLFPALFLSIMIKFKVRHFYKKTTDLFPLEQISQILLLIICSFFLGCSIYGIFNLTHLLIAPPNILIIPVALIFYALFTDKLTFEEKIDFFKPLMKAISYYRIKK